MGAQESEVDQPAPLVHVSVRVPADLLERLDAVRRPYRTRMRRTEHIRAALREYVERHGGAQ